MAAIAALVLADGNTTPVNRTFVPAAAPGKLGETAIWLDKTSSYSNGFKQVSLQLSARSNGGIKIVTKIKDPILATLQPGQTIPGVAGTQYADLTVLTDGIASEQDRKNLFAYIKSLMNLPVATNPFYAAIVTGEVVW